MKVNARVRGAIATIAVASTVTFGLAGVAAASDTGALQTDVSCDGTTVKVGATVVQRYTGNLAIKQNFSSPSSQTNVTARSSNGNDLGAKTIGTGGTATWTGVLPSSYTVRAHRSGASQCNGILPGYGNYTWGYTVTYAG